MAETTETKKKGWRGAAPNSIIGMIAVLLVGILCQSSGAESPALPYIAEEFNDLPFSSIVQITTVPSIMMIPASLLYAWLRRHVAVRPLFIVSMILLIGGGVMPSFANDFSQIIIGRAIFGIGVGVMWPLAQSVIVELYEGTRQNTLLGFNSIITSCGGILWGLAGGILALQGWRVSFDVYYIPIIVLIFVAIFLPAIGKAAPKKEEKALENAEKKSGMGKGVVGIAVLLMVAYFAYNFFNMTYFTNLSMKVVGDGLGDSASAGVAQSMFTVGSIIIGLIFGLVMKNKFMNKYAIGIGWVITGIGMLINSQSSTFVMICVGSVIQGFGTGMFMPAMVGKIGNLAGKANASTILGISTCVLGASQFFGPTIMNMVVEGMGLGAGGPVMLLGGVGHLICAVIALIIITVLRNKNLDSETPTQGETQAA